MRRRIARWLIRLANLINSPPGGIGPIPHPKIVLTPRERGVSWHGQKYIDIVFPKKYGPSHLNTVQDARKTLVSGGDAYSHPKFRNPRNFGRRRAPGVGVEPPFP